MSMENLNKINIHFMPLLGQYYSKNTHPIVKHLKEISSMFSGQIA
jgi:hypothetical protein